MRNGRIAWSWERPDVDTDDVPGSPRFWSIRLPLATERGEWGWINLYREFTSDPLLVDMNYLCDLFRRQLSEATERVLRSATQQATSQQAAVSNQQSAISNQPAIRF